MFSAQMRKRISVCTATAMLLASGSLLPESAMPKLSVDTGSALAATIAATPITTSATMNFTIQGTTSEYFDISGNLSTSKGTMTYNGETLTQCLKMETATSITFSTGSACTLTLVIKDGDTIYVDGTKYSIDASGVTTISIDSGSHSIAKGSGSSNLFYIAVSGGDGSPVETTAPITTDSGTISTTTTTGTVPSHEVVTPGNISVSSAGGWNEMMYAVLTGVSDSDITGVSYTGASSGSLTGQDLEYLVRDVSGGVRVDVLGLKPGIYTLNIETTGGTVSISNITVGAQDRSGYAHFNYNAGVGAYNNDGTLKSNAVVLYVTDSNKNSVTVTSKDGTTVTGIGNILNSGGQDNGSGQTSKGGKPNSNSDIIEKIAKDGTPLVIRIIGNVTAPDGLTAYDSVDYGGSVGDNGYMARMQSGKDVTIEGVGTDATINGWGIHFIAESANTNLGESFEVRNIAFRNVPEDCIGMEGVQSDDALTAPVEHCWIHNCEFYAPSISNPAESDKDGGDGACDFKRGLYFTNSYCYYEGYHKTNLVGSSDTSLQYHITFHHNYWKSCESRGPLARHANIHMYNNIFEGQTSYCMNPRATAFIFSEYNLFENSKDPMTLKSEGVVKSYNDTINNCSGDQDGVFVSSRSETVSNSNLYGDFERNSSLSYIPSGNYVLQESTANLKSNFESIGGCMDEDSGSSGSVVTQPTTTTTTSTTTTTTTTTTTGDVAATLVGDIDCNGTVNIADCVLLSRFVSEDSAAVVSSEGRANADCSGDQQITATDCSMILQFLANISDTL